MGSRPLILLDTHVWVWWVHGDPRLDERASRVVSSHQSSGLGVSVISCWEVAKLVEVGRLELPLTIDEWLDKALAYPGVTLFDLTVPIAVESTRLPSFHRDPVDQLLAATSRVLGLPLATADRRLVEHHGVETLDLR